MKYEATAKGGSRGPHHLFWASQTCPDVNVSWSDMSGWISHPVKKIYLSMLPL